MVAYWCAWYKHYFPREFMTALFLTNEADAGLYIRESRRMGIPVLPPDINRSSSRFSLTDEGIRYGLHTIKYVANAADIIEAHRPFKSVRDAFDRLPARQVNKRVWMAMLKVGACDSLVGDDDRRDLPNMSDRERALFRYLECRREVSSFDDARKEMKDIIKNEVELLGVSLTVDPFGGLSSLMMSEDNLDDIQMMMPGERRVVCGRIARVRKLKTKRGANPGKAMAQVWIDRPNESDLQQVVCFPAAYAVYADILKEGKLVWAKVERLEDPAVQMVEVVDLESV
jgi:DNA polymerase-3 subunit alpha